MSDEAKFTQADLDALKTELRSEIDALKEKNSDLVSEKRALQKSAAITPEQLAAVEEARDKALSDLAEAGKQIKTLTTDKEKAVKALEAEQGFTQKLLIQDGLKSALIASGVKDEDFIDSLTAKFSIGASVVTEGDARVAKIGDKALADAIKDWAGSDAGKKFVQAPVNGGGGAQGGKSGGDGSANPFAKDSFNMTDQARMLRENPAEAVRLAEAAGVNLAN